MAQAMLDRFKALKSSALDAEDARRRREERTVELRRKKQASLLSSKRRRPAPGRANGADDAELGEADLDALTTLAECAFAANRDDDAAGDALAQLDDLLSSLSSAGTPATRAAAARQLRLLLSADAEPPVGWLVRSGVCLPSLVELLSGADVGPDTRLDAAWCLTNVAATKYTHAVVDAGAAAPLARLADPSSSAAAASSLALRTQCVWCLGNLAGDSAATRDALLREHGVVQCLVQGLRVGMPEDDGALDGQMDAYEVGMSIAGDDEDGTRTSCGSMDRCHGAGLPASLNLLLLRNAAWAVANLSEATDVGPSGLGSAVVPLARLLRHSDTETVRLACVALSRMTAGDDARAAEVLRAAHAHDRGGMVAQAIVEPLLASLGRSDASDFLLPALACVGNILAGAVKETQTLVDSGVVFALGRLLARQAWAKPASDQMELDNDGGRGRAAGGAVDDGGRADAETQRREVCLEIVWMSSNLACGTPAQIDALLPAPAASSIGDESVEAEAGTGALGQHGGGTTSNLMRVILDLGRYSSPQSSHPRLRMEVAWLLANICRSGQPVHIRRLVMCGGLQTWAALLATEEQQVAVAVIEGIDAALRKWPRQAPWLGLGGQLAQALQLCGIVSTLEEITVQSGRFGLDASGKAELLLKKFFTTSSVLGMATSPVTAAQRAPGTKFSTAGSAASTGTGTGTDKVAGKSGAGASAAEQAAAEEEEARDMVTRELMSLLAQTQQGQGQGQLPGAGEGAGAGVGDIHTPIPMDVILGMEDRRTSAAMVPSLPLYGVVPPPVRRQQRQQQQEHLPVSNFTIPSEEAEEDLMMLRASSENAALTQCICCRPDGAHASCQRGCGYSQGDTEDAGLGLGRGLATVQEGGEGVNENGFDDGVDAMEISSSGVVGLLGDLDDDGAASEQPLRHQVQPIMMMMGVDGGEVDDEFGESSSSDDPVLIEGLSFFLGSRDGDGGEDDSSSRSTPLLGTTREER